MGQNDDGRASEGDVRSPVRSAEFAPEDADPLYVVTELLAKELDSSPLELTPPIGHVVDWDAVVALLRHSGDTGTVRLIRFSYLDYVVEIRGSGSVTLLSDSA